MFLTTLFKAATPENPKFGLNDPRAWDEIGSAPSSSGIKVSREVALTHDAWWRGITLIANTVGKVPAFIYRRIRQAGRDGKVRAKEHGSYPLLRFKPSPRMTAFQFKRLLTGHAIGGGNGYAYVVRRGDQTIDQLLPLNPDATFPLLANGELWYTTSVDRDQRRLPGADVLHVKGFGFDGLVGYSVFDKAKEAIGEGVAARKHSTLVFKHGNRPSVVLEFPGKLTEPQVDQITKRWERMGSGLDNHHKTAILDHGLTAKTMAFNNRDAQMLELRKFNVREIANFLNLPPHKLSDETRTAYASLEQENQAFLDDSIDPWLVTWEEECWDKLLTEEEKANDTHVVEFLRQALVRVDLDKRGNYYRTALGGAPWMTVGEVRDAENLAPKEGTDDMLLPLNMGQGGADNEPAQDAPPAKQPPEEETTDDADQESGVRSQESAARDRAAAAVAAESNGHAGGSGATSAAATAARLPAVDRASPDPAAKAPASALRTALAQVLEDVGRRMLHRLTTHACRAARAPDRFLAWLDGMPADHARTIGEAFAPPISAVNAALGIDHDPEMEAAKLLGLVSGRLLELSGACTAANLEVEVSRLANRLDREFPALWSAHLTASGPGHRQEGTDPP